MFELPGRTAKTCTRDASPSQLQCLLSVDTFRLQACPVALVGHSGGSVILTAAVQTIPSFGPGDAVLGDGKPMSGETLKRCRCEWHVRILLGPGPLAGRTREGSLLRASCARAGRPFRRGAGQAPFQCPLLSSCRSHHRPAHAQDFAGWPPTWQSSFGSSRAGPKHPRGSLRLGANSVASGCGSLTLLCLHSVIAA